MSRRRTVFGLILAIAAIGLVALMMSGGSSLSSSPSPSSDSPEQELDGGHERGGEAEAEEEAHEAAERLEAWQEAKEAGTLRVNRAQMLAAAAPAPGWAGEQVVSPTADDWEPAIAADPNSPYVYLLTTRYTRPTACGNKCPLPYIMLKVSSDGGVTWGPDRYICTCSGVGSQADPIIEVVPNTGAVYAAFMNGFNVMFTKSTDHGATWSTPVSTYGKVSWNDKPILATSDNGNDVYVSFNGPQSGDPYVAQSHNGGPTWTQTKIVNSTRYFFAFDGDVLPNGTVVFSETSLDYGGPGGSLVGQAQVNVLRSTNNGASFTANLVDTVELSPDCTAAGCPEDYYPGHTAITADSAGTLVLLYDGATVSKGTRRSGPVARRTAGQRGRHARRCRRPVRWRTSPRRRLAAPATSAPGTCRRTAATSTHGTSGTGPRPTAADLERAGQDLRRDRGRHIQDRQRVPRALRRLRRGRDHEHREVHRDLGRGQLLHRSRRSVDQPADIAGPGVEGWMGRPKAAPSFPEAQ